MRSSSDCSVRSSSSRSGRSSRGRRGGPRLNLSALRTASSTAGLQSSSSSRLLGTRTCPLLLVRRTLRATVPALRAPWRPTPFNGPHDIESHVQQLLLGLPIWSSPELLHRLRVLVLIDKGDAIH